MPITQTRMLALIRAGHDYQQALRVAIDLISRQRNFAELGTISWQEAMLQLEAMANPIGLLNYPMDSGSTLAVEASHFASHGRRNEKAKRKAASARGPTAPGGKTAPQDLRIKGALFVSKIKRFDAGVEVLRSPVGNLSPETMAQLEREAQAAMEEEDPEGPLVLPEEPI